MENLTFKRKLFSLIGGFIVHIVIGTIYITGNISIYMASYLRKYDSSITLDDTSLILPLQVVGTCLSLVVGPYLLNHTNPWM